MKRITINESEIGISFRNNGVKRVLTSGTHWVSILDNIYIYDLTNKFTPHIDLDIILRNNEIQQHLEVVDVMDNELVLRYENNIFKEVLTVGKYAFWKGIKAHRFVKIDTTQLEVDSMLDRNIILKPTIYQYIRSVSIEPAQKGLLYIDGIFSRLLEPGEYLFWKNATKVHSIKADTRLQQMEISGQEILTYDKAPIRINFFTTYKIVDFVKALDHTKDHEKQLYLLLQLSLREFIGSLTLDELLEKKDTITAFILEETKAAVDNIGIKLQGCGIRDVILPGEVKEIMNQVLIAQKKAQANIITRREETASTRSLLNTAKLLEENTMLYKLKEMEYVEKIADKINNITLSGGSLVVDQLKDIFITKK